MSSGGYAILWLLLKILALVLELSSMAMENDDYNTPITGAIILERLSRLLARPRTARPFTRLRTGEVKSVTPAFLEYIKSATRLREARFTHAPKPC